MATASSTGILTLNVEQAALIPLFMRKFQLATIADFTPASFHDLYSIIDLPHDAHEEVRKQKLIVWCQAHLPREYRAVGSAEPACQGGWKGLVRLSMTVGEKEMANAAADGAGTSKKQPHPPLPHVATAVGGDGHGDDEGDAVQQKMQKALAERCARAQQAVVRGNFSAAVMALTGGINIIVEMTDLIDAQQDHKQEDVGEVENDEEDL